MNGHPQFDEDLDLYALDALEGEAKQALEAHLAGCADCTHRLEEARGRVALLSLAAPSASPPLEGRETLLQLVRGAAPVPQPAPRVSPIWRWTTPPLALATLLLIIALAKFRTENHDLRLGIRELQADAEIQKTQTARARAIMNLLSSPDTMKINLVASPLCNVPHGKVFCHPTKGLLFYATNLPALPSDRTYQLWLVPMEGSPINAGIFQCDGHGNGEVVLPPIPMGIEPKAFAVTVEPAGGMPQPTGPKLMVGAAS